MTLAPEKKALQAKTNACSPPLAVCLAAGLAAGTVSSAQADAWLTDPITGCSIWTDKLDPLRETATWAGPCEGGKASGEGVLVWFKDGHIVGRYEGAMREGKLHGRGVLYYRPPDTLARMRADVQVQTSDEGRIFYHFEGTLRDGKMEGRGILYYRSERGYDRYEGEFRDGEIDGEIVFKGSDGGSFEGTAKGIDGSGEGVYVGASGERYEGAFAKGQPDGPGTYTAPNGDVFEATFVDGKAHGKVTVTRADGKREELSFDHGQPAK